MSLTQLNPNTPLEGPACQVRFSEERACRVRRAALDYPSRFRGHDERAPPSGRDRHAPPYVRITVVVPTILAQILKTLPRFP